MALNMVMDSTVIFAPEDSRGGNLLLLERWPRWVIVEMLATGANLEQAAIRLTTKEVTLSTKIGLDLQTLVVC